MWIKNTSRKITGSDGGQLRIKEREEYWKRKKGRQIGGEGREDWEERGGDVGKGEIEKQI